MGGHDKHMAWDELLDGIEDATTSSPLDDSLGTLSVPLSAGRQNRKDAIAALPPLSINSPEYVFVVSAPVTPPPEKRRSLRPRRHKQTCALTLPPLAHNRSSRSSS